MQSKILIGGTGRAGTTLLVRILTCAGLETGFKESEFTQIEGSIGRAGLEFPVSYANRNHLPVVVKSPHLVEVLPRILEEKWFQIGLAIIPIRDLSGATASRCRVHQKALDLEICPQSVPGGLWKTANPADQRLILAENFYRTVEPLIAHEVPHLFLSFPKFAKDIEYFDRTLGSTLEKSFGLDRLRLRNAHMKQCNLNLIFD